GYVSRKQKAGNRKNVYVHLTGKGKELKAKLLPLAEEINAIAINELELDEVLIARKVLLKITANLNAYENELLESENRRVPSTGQWGRLYTAWALRSLGAICGQETSKACSLCVGSCSFITSSSISLRAWMGPASVRSATGNGESARLRCCASSTTLC